MNSLLVLLALLLPVTLGTAAWQAILGRPRDAAGWAASLGAGYVLGMLFVGIGMGWWSSLSPQPRAVALMQLRCSLTRMARVVAVLTR